MAPDAERDLDVLRMECCDVRWVAAGERCVVESERDGGVLCCGRTRGG